MESLGAGSLEERLGRGLRTGPYNSESGHQPSEWTILHGMVAMSLQSKGDEREKRPAPHHQRALRLRAPAQHPAEPVHVTYSASASNLTTNSSSHAGRPEARPYVRSLYSNNSSDISSELFTEP